MRWRTGRRSDNVEDRRSEGSGLGDPFGGRAPMRMGRSVGIGGGIGGVILVVVLMLMGVDPSFLLTPADEVAPRPTQGTPQGGHPQFQAPTPGVENELKDFVSVVLADTEDTWKALFAQAGKRYTEPRLVLYTGVTRSACGLGEAAMGPFYCPADQKVYIDLAFYDELRNDFGAPGDFAQAYVIAHEIGHHVQNLLGISDQIEALRGRMNQREANRLLVRLELQADCLAGVWANHAQRARQILERGDLEEGLRAASAIGDDRLQRQTRGYVTPDSFTHGSSAQRVRWFKRGLADGRIGVCDTFNTQEL